MARWRLTAAHYLKIKDTRWRYEETDRETGERVEQVYDVPRFLDPSNPRDCRSAGDCIVSFPEGAQRGDWILIDEKQMPTPDMEPLDADAEAITTEMQKHWTHPMEDMPSQGGFNQTALLEGLEKQLTAAFANASKAIGTQPVSLKGVDPDEFKQLQEQVAALMARNAELEAGKPKAAARRA